MKTLAQLEDEAKDRPNTHWEFLIIHPKSGPHNGRFLDPDMGIVEMKEIPGKFVLTDDLDKWNTTGVFLKDSD